jgi:hypothetical protein
LELRFHWNQLYRVKPDHMIAISFKGHQMTRIRFPDPTVERRALGFLAGRFSFKSSSSGETVVPEAAMSALAQEGISFTTHREPPRNEGLGQWLQSCPEKGFFVPIEE